MPEQKPIHLLQSPQLITKILLHDHRRAVMLISDLVNTHPLLWTNVRSLLRKEPVLYQALKDSHVLFRMGFIDW